jgi:hypothetical protein
MIHSGFPQFWRSMLNQRVIYLHHDAYRSCCQYLKNPIAHRIILLYLLLLLFIHISATLWLGCADGPHHSI